MHITVTDKAMEQLLVNGVNKDNFLKLGVEPGGCAGMSYDLFIDNNRTDHDEVVFERGSVRILAAKQHLSMLDGLTIDYSDDLIQPGFILKNPNAQQACGCGASFKVETTDVCTSCRGCD